MYELEYTYTNDIKIRRLWGDDAVEARTDIDVDVMRDAVEWATERINAQCEKLYEASDLAQSRLVMRWATVLAANYISKLQGNPPQYVDAAQDVENQLQQVADGVFQIPRLPTRANSVPMATNYRMDDRYQNPVRVNPRTSTGGTYSNQPSSNPYYDGYGYGW